MPPDVQRIRRTAEGLSHAGLSGIVCSLSSNVLLLSGYWPVVGTSMVVAGALGRVALVTPEDETDEAKKGWADDIFTFNSGSLEDLHEASDVIAAPLRQAMAAVGAGKGAVGYESDAWRQPMSYVAMNLYGSRMPALIKQASPQAAPVSADELLRQWRSILTPVGIGSVRRACDIAARAFAQAAGILRTGSQEADLAARLRVHLTDTAALPADGHIAIVSGINSARAFGAYARSSDKALARGELIMMHCNSQAQGYWTDITRTFCLGNPNSRQQQMYAAVRAARDAAMAAIKPGVPACTIDQAARSTLAAAGFDREFRHPTGHGVGYAAIDHNAIPRIHPQSNDILMPGMIFNVEPAVYIDGAEGMRHCDMVVVSETGAELLTPFLTATDELLLP